MTQGQSGPTNHLRGRARVKKLQSIVKDINEEIRKLRDRKYICMMEMIYVMCLDEELFERYPDYNCRWVYEIC